MHVDHLVNMALLRPIEPGVPLTRLLVCSRSSEDHTERRAWREAPLDTDQGFGNRPPKHILGVVMGRGGEVSAARAETGRRCRARDGSLLVR